MKSLPLKILSLGLTPYREVWKMQQEIQRSLIAGDNEQTLVFCEHPAVITCGRSAKEKNLLLNQEALLQKGIEVVEIERGGDYTYHGPGQLVAYPLIDLRTRKRDVAWYLRTLEEVTLEVLKSYGVSGVRVPGRTGVWTLSPEQEPSAKICSIGVRISRWCTLHGASLYVKPQSSGFQWINPCGFDDISVVSLKELDVDCSLPEVEGRYTEAFCKAFHFEVSI